jgi:hypothetical protein
MKLNDPLQDQHFAYDSQGRFWWRYLPVIVGVLFVYFILLLYEVQPFSVPAFWLLIALVTLDVGVTGILRGSAPREFRVNEESLTIEWAQGSVTEPLRSVSIRRMLSRLLTSGTIVKAGERSFAVFHDLQGYNELLSVIDQRPAR